jgi:serine O-acetyltransferase
VVTKEVPANATVVGVPGRVIERSKDIKEEQRAATARKMGFDAYGATTDAPDPVATAINCMLDHIHVMDKKMEGMCETLKSMGAEVEDLKMPGLVALEIHTEGEEDKGEEDKK